MAYETTKLVLGRGELYFAPFGPDMVADAGEVYLGNTTEFVTSREVETKDSYDSFDGQKIKAEGAVVKEIHGARFTTDNIALDNLSFWFGEEVGTFVQNRSENLSETVFARKGRYFQLGITPTLPIGIRGIESVEFYRAEDLETQIPELANFDLDKRQGRFQILPDAPDVENGDEIVVQYEQRDIVSSVLESGKREFFGSLRYISRNPVGPQKNYFYPFVKLMPIGEIDHKSNTWQTLSFEVEIQRRNPLFQYVYIDEIQTFGGTIFAVAIEEMSGITYEQFPFWENALDRIVNTRLPQHF